MELQSLKEARIEGYDCNPYIHMKYGIVILSDGKVRKITHGFGFIPSELFTFTAGISGWAIT